MAANRRQHTKELKLQVVREVEAGKSIAQASREHQVYPTLSTRWRAALQKHPESAISGNGNTYTYEARIAELDRLIGQHTVENSDLKKACPSSRRGPHPGS